MGATLSRNELPRRHARELSRVVLTLCARHHDFLQAATQGEYDLRIPTTFLPALTTSFLHITLSIFYSTRLAFRTTPLTKLKLPP